MIKCHRGLEELPWSRLGVSWIRNMRSVLFRFLELQLELAQDPRGLL